MDTLLIYAAAFAGSVTGGFIIVWWLFRNARF